MTMELTEDQRAAIIRVLPTPWVDRFFSQAWPVIRDMVLEAAACELREAGRHDCASIVRGMKGQP